MQKQQLNEINSLQAKLKEVQGALNQLINEKESLERQLKNSQMAKSLRDKKIDDLNNELNKLKKVRNASNCSFYFYSIFNFIFLLNTIFH